ncbi:hypothetical protein GA0116948_11951 [Chitinophaga costaii]|uniref:Uncharacterized protein n=1 Tax=Chitinophaga costaii TaxID=1335309 RepID=A0A1C4G0Z9_9BACT|nr:hypothetical protein GA0116948_11951 [Chitinophaga costaii]
MGKKARPLAISITKAPAHHGRGLLRIVGECIIFYFFFTTTVPDQLSCQG